MRIISLTHFLRPHDSSRPQRREKGEPAERLIDSRLYGSDGGKIKFTKVNISQVIRAAVAVLKRGGVIAYPTETTYGLGCDPRNTKAVAKIYRIKGREKKKPFLLVASSVAQVRRVARLQATSFKLQIQYWPGPLTLVLPVKTEGAETALLRKSITPHGEVAIRVSLSPFVEALCRAYGFPIVSTSANKSGELDCRSGKAMIKIFRNQKYQPDLIIDFGALPRRKPSTVARVRADGSIEVLRRGAIRLDSA